MKRTETRMKISEKSFVNFPALLGTAVLALALGLAQARGGQAGTAPSGADHPDHFTMKTANGYLFVSNYDQSPFTVRLRGKDVEQGTLGEGDSAFTVYSADGLIVQFNTAGVAQFIQGDPSKLTDEDILEKHMEWELAYIEKSLGQKVKLGMHIATRVNAKDVFYYWEYDMPHPVKGGVIRNLMLTARVKNNLMVLNGMLTDEKDEKAMMGKLFEMAGTLTPAPAPITVDQARAEALKN
jgi:hypothetical protein